MTGRAYIQPEALIDNIQTELLLRLCSDILDGACVIFLFLFSSLVLTIPLIQERGSAKAGQMLMETRCSLTTIVNIYI